MSEWSGAVIGNIPSLSDPEMIRKQNGSLRTLLACQEEELKVLRAKAREHHEAVQTLDSEREANARMTDDLLVYAKDCAALHDVQHDAACLVRPKGGGSIILWAAAEIAALRAALPKPLLAPEEGRIL